MPSDLPYSTSDIKQEVKIRMLSESGQAALPPTTVMAFFDERVKEMGDKPALHYKDIQQVGLVLACTISLVRAVIVSAIEFCPL